MDLLQRVIVWLYSEFLHLGGWLFENPKSAAMALGVIIIAIVALRFLAGLLKIAIIVGIAAVAVIFVFSHIG